MTRPRCTFLTRSLETRRRSCCGVTRYPPSLPRTYSRPSAHQPYSTQLRPNPTLAKPPPLPPTHTPVPHHNPHPSRPPSPAPTSAGSSQGPPAPAHPGTPTPSLPPPGTPSSPG